MFCKTFSRQRNSQPRSTRSPSQRSSSPRAPWETRPATRTRTSSPRHSGAVIFTALGRKRRLWPDVQCHSGKCRRNLGIRFAVRRKWNVKFTYVVSHQWNLRRQKLLRSRVSRITERRQSKNQLFWTIYFWSNYISWRFHSASLVFTQC